MANPELAKTMNIRDTATINQLIVLSNIESMNAELIKQVLTKEARFAILLCSDIQIERGYMKLPPYGYRLLYFQISQSECHYIVFHFTTECIVVVHNCIIGCRIVFMILLDCGKRLRVNIIKQIKFTFGDGVAQMSINGHPF